MQSLIFLSVDREVDQKFFVIIFSTRNIQQDDILIFWMCCWGFLKNVNFFVYNLSCQSWVIGLTSDSIFTFGKTHQMRKLLSGQIDCVTLICTNRILQILYIIYIRKNYFNAAGRELAFENFFRSIFFWNIRVFQKFKKFSWANTSEFGVKNVL